MLLTNSGERIYIRFEEKKFTNVGTTIEETPINQNNCGLVSDQLCNFDEDVLQHQLLVHERPLEHKTLLTSKTC